MRRLARRPGGDPRPADPPQPQPAAAPRGPRPDREDARARRRPGALLRAGAPRERHRRRRRVVETLERHLEDPITEGTTLLRAQTEIGRYELGEGNAVAGVLAALAALDARRAILVSEPRAWEVAGAALADGAGRGGRPRRAPPAAGGRGRQAHEHRRGRGARARPASRGARRPARGDRRRRAGRHGGLPRRDLAARRADHPRAHDARGPDRLVDRGQDRGRPAGGQEPRRRLPPAGGRRRRRPLPPDAAARQLRAALGEAAKMAALGDERLFELLEADGAAIAAGEPRAHDGGAVAEVVERCGWAKIEVVTADEREQGGRINLNLGHSLAHAIEAAAGFEGISPRRGGGLRAARRLPDRRGRGDDAAGAGGADRGASRRPRPGARGPPLPARRRPRPRS